MHALNVALDRFGAHRHRAVDPGADLDRRAARDVAREPVWNLYREAEAARAHALIEVRVVAQRRTFDEVARAREIERVILAQRGMVAVENRELEILHVHADAVGEHDHEDRAAEPGERQADRVVAQLESLAAGVAEEPAQAECAAAAGGRTREHGGGGMRRLGGEVRRLRRAALVDFLETAHECILEGARTALRDDRRRRVGDENPARVHQSDPIAALRLVHEMRGDEDRDVLGACEIDHDAPEAVARDRVHARGRLVEDQNFRSVDHRDRERQALALAQRQRGRQRVHDRRETEALGDMAHARRDLRARHAEQARVQFEVLPHVELAVERKPLRHVAHAAARLEVARVDRAAEQPRLSLGRGQKTGQHLHRRRLAAAVGADEAEDLAAIDVKAHVVDGDEVAESHRQIARLDGRRAVGARPARHDLDGPVIRAPRRRQQVHEGFFETAGSGAREDVARRAAVQDPARVHRNEPIEALGFLHVGRGHEYAHAGPAGADAVDEFPELTPRQRVDARGRLVEDQQVRLVDQRAAEAELLLHAAGQLIDAAVPERRESGRAQQHGDSPLAFGALLAEQAPEEIDVIEHRERAVQVLAEPLRKIGDARTDAGAMPGIAQVCTQHVDPPRLDRTGARHERQEARLADPVRPDDADHAARGQIQIDVRQRRRLAVAQTHAAQSRDGRRRPGRGCGHGGSLTARRAGHAAAGSIFT